MKDATGAAEEQPRAQALRAPRPVFDLLVGLCLAAASVWFYLAARGIDGNSGEPMEPYSLPVALALILVLLALAMAAQSVLRMLRGHAGVDVVEIRRPSGVLVGMAAVAAFPAVMMWGGYYPTMAVFIPVLLLAGGYRSRVGMVAYTAGFLAFTYLVFQLLLKTPLP